MITEELLAAGYRKYPREAIKEYCDFFYQKKITDEEGARYFIDFWHYPPFTHHHSGMKYPETWLFEVTMNEPHSTFEIHRPEDIAHCERKAEEFWRMMGAVYYERNES